MADFEIWDSREPTRTQGGYESREAAQEAADAVNEYIYKNTLGVVLGPAKEVTGPYYVRPEMPKRRVPGRVAVYDAAVDPHLKNLVVS